MNYSMKLSDFFQDSDILRDGEFHTLGYVDSNTKGTLSYCDTISYLQKANQNQNIGCIITKKQIADQVEPHKGVVLSPNPRNTFYVLHNSLLENKNYGLRLEYDMGDKCTIHHSAVVSKRTRIGHNVTIAENVVIKDEVMIGDNTFVDAGVVIGCEGLLYVVEDGNLVFVRHVGGVKIGKNVTILSNAVIARSIHDHLLTTVGENTIIGVASNVGHEAKIGNNCAISSHCVIARRAKICDGAWVGPSSVIREHVMIGKFAQVKMGSIVVKDVKENQAVSGNFALDHKINLLHYAQVEEAIKNRA
ncbi:MAG: UDP-3-O-(3-hydroxymyristoyl)glucosamine N-acyltransferase [Deltaproteobacteria bacterium]|nr:UDP-3-O-(3-hydroxymyristoyl)glucosamine N-acyltransferase [Deltaproteobacteria bacterium]